MQAMLHLSQDRALLTVQSSKLMFKLNATMSYRNWILFDAYPNHLRESSREVDFRMSFCHKLISQPLAIVWNPKKKTLKKTQQFKCKKSEPLLDITGRHWIKEFSAVTSENNNNNIVEMKCLAYLVQCNLYCFSFNTKERIFFSIYPRVEGRTGERAGERSRRFIWNGKQQCRGMFTKQWH